MKPTFSIPTGLLHNEDEFTHPFFQRFKLRHAPAPIRLYEKISNNYSFPTFYNNVTCAMAIYHCDYDAAHALMPHPKMLPVRMTLDRSLVVFSCYAYRSVMNVPPYHEVAMTIPVMVDPLINVPVLPMISDAFKEFGYYVFSMPVTSEENRLRGNNIWGLPKVTQAIEITEQGGDNITTIYEETGEPYLRVTVPTAGSKEHFDAQGYLYTRLGNDFLRAKTCFLGDFNVNKHMDLLVRKNAPADKETLWLGDTPSGQHLRALGIEEKPFQTRYAHRMVACFDLPEEGYKSKLG